MNLNTIRLEGKLEDENFFNLADKYGILVMPGWSCCDAWQVINRIFIIKNNYEKSIGNFGNLNNFLLLMNP